MADELTKAAKRLVRVSLKNYGPEKAQRLAELALMTAVHQLLEPPPSAPSVRRRKWPTRTTQRIVWDRDGWECQICGTHRGLTIDHIVPFVHGGSDELDNLRTLCWSCNSRRGAGS